MTAPGAYYQSHESVSEVHEPLAVMRLIVRDVSCSSCLFYAQPADA